MGKKKYTTDELLELLDNAVKANDKWLFYFHNPETKKEEENESV